MAQNWRFMACRANFFAEQPRNGLCWANFFAEQPRNGLCWANYFAEEPLNGLCWANYFAEEPLNAPCWVSFFAEVPQKEQKDLSRRRPPTRAPAPRELGKPATASCRKKIPTPRRRLMRSG